MKSIIPAALVIVLEAGFLFSIASLPGPATSLGAEVQVARAAPAAQAPAPAPAAPRASRS
jgi:hypothetical protein